MVGGNLNIKERNQIDMGDSRREAKVQNPEEKKYSKGSFMLLRIVWNWWQEFRADHLTLFWHLLCLCSLPSQFKTGVTLTFSQLFEKTK